MQAQNYTCILPQLMLNSNGQIEICIEDKNIEVQKHLKQEKGCKRGYYSKLSPEKKEERRRKNREYYRNVIMTKERLERRKEQISANLKKLSPEEKEEQKRKRREYQKKAQTKESYDQRKERMRECYKRISAEEKKKMKQEWHEKYQNLSPEKKEERKQKSREYYKKGLTEEQKERRREQNREWRKRQKEIQTQESHDQKKNQTRKCYEQLSSEKKEEKKQKWRENYKKLTAEQMEKRRQRKREYYRKKNKGKQKTSDRSEALKSEAKENLEYCEGMKLQDFCYVCRTAFSNQTALFEHIVGHITLPSIVVSRIDKFKKALHTVKKKNQNTQINNSLHSDMPRNIVYIKTEHIEYDDDIRLALNNVKTENENEIDNVSVYDCIQEESQNMQINSCLHKDTSQNVVLIKTERVEYDEDIEPELNNSHMNIKNEIENDDVPFYVCVSNGIEEV